MKEGSGAATSPPDKKLLGGVSSAKDDMSEEDILPAIFSRATTCPARVVQADEDMMFRFDEDFHEEAAVGDRMAEGDGDDAAESGTCSEGLRPRADTLSGLFFLDE